ncbi:MAG: MASE1 domain-containing protein [Rhodospirillaceae bacterium]|nr:MASE1 domain-containing protein [Rhodospirillaceae bacterium]
MRLFFFCFITYWEVVSPRLEDSRISVMFLPIAVLFFALLVSRSRWDIAGSILAFVGAMMAWVLIEGHSVVDAIPYQVIDILEPATIVYALRRRGLRGLTLRNPGRVLQFTLGVLGIAAVYALITAIYAVSTQGDVVTVAFNPLRFWRDWYFGNVTAYFTLGAGLLMWRGLSRRRARALIDSGPRQFGLAVGFLVVAVLYDFEVLPIMEYLAFGTLYTDSVPHPALVFLTLPAVIWLAYRFNQLGASIGILITTVPAIHMVAAGFGPRWLDGTADRVLILQAYIGLSALVAFVVASLSYHVRRRQRLLQRALGLARRRARDRAYFLSTFDHEIRTPLNGILGFTELMLSEIDGPLTPTYREYVEIIDKASKRLLSMSTEILSLRRMEAGKFDLNLQRIVPNQVVERVVELLRGIAERRGVDLVNDVPLSLTVVANEVGLHHAVANALSNALRHTPEGGRVTVSGATAPDTVVIEVADTGSGFVPEDVLERFRLNVGDQRAGFGLKLIDTIMALHDGSMTIDSAPGAGTTLRLHFPVSRS